jgi:hypothetical protein
MSHSADGALEKDIAGLRPVAISYLGILWHDPSDAFWLCAHL